MENALDTRFENIFPDTNQTVAALQITDYLEWAAHPEKYSRELAMPPIQRGFVWKPKQIQDLWDSLLRGMPIGSILLKASQPYEQSAELAPDRTVKKNPKYGFHLMDGQQRTLTMLLGFPGSVEAQHKLWIDFSESGKYGSQFQFRVTTAAQPFGYSADGGRLSLPDRREARAMWDGKDEKKEKQTNLEIFADETTRPWKAGGKQQEYIFEVKRLWQWLDGQGTTVSDWVGTVKTKILKDDDTAFVKGALERIEKFCIALKELRNQWLALIKIPDVKVQVDLEDPSHDYLTMLFARISSGGTELKPEELLFSMIKQSWPDAHNIVYELQKQVGSLMKPTDFVMTAFRLAALQSDDITVRGTELNAKTFHKHLAALLGTNDQPGTLRKMIGEGGPLVEAFKKMIGLIEYRNDEARRHAIPSIMFPYLNVSMLQVILYWMICNQENMDSFENSKDDITRFILFWFVSNRDAKSAYKASKVAIEIISKQKGHFPGEKIYQSLTQKDEDMQPLFLPLIQPPQRDFESEQFRFQNDRGIYFFGVENSPLYNNFTARKMLLLWFQRKWVADKFQSITFTPLAGQDEDNVPYDLDHLVPQSNWSDLRGIPTGNIERENVDIFKNSHHRQALGNSIGNYRVMDSSENRSRGDESLQLGLLQTEDKWNDYSFNPDREIELPKWRLASPEKDGWKWDDVRLLAFQYTIESRVSYLYKRYFDEAGFNAWVTTPA